MKSFLLLLPGALATMIAAGCTSAGGSDVDRWVQRHGGTIECPGQQRAAVALAAIVPAEARAGLSVRILDSTEVGAFSWRSGEIYLTRGLVDLASDEELSAAIAHEIGHLVSDGHVTMPATLNGRAGDPDAEVQADCVAADLLQRANRSSQSLVHLLEKISAEKGTSDELRLQLQERIRRLGGEGRLPAHS